MHAISRRAIAAAAVAGATIALTAGGIGTASAHGRGGSNPGHSGGNGGSRGCSTVGVQYQVDGGDWTAAGRIGGDTAPGKISVKLTSTPGKNCVYTVSLASYSTEGPAWENSGHQDFLGWDTVTLDSKHTSATLDVSAHTPQCYGQVDLYGNGTQYDGATGEGHGALPHYPDSVTPPNLITAWNGGHECQTTPSPTDTPTTGSPSPTDTATTGSPSPTDTATTGSPSPTDTATTGSPSPSVSDTAAPTGTPSVPPATGTGTGNLAETGSNSSQNTALIGGAAALLVAGGAAVYFTRRRRTGNHS
ncbi:LAETG motif-containing sortase-dependent surface protein [Streptomyces sp. NRRL F-5123]|uniref:LAETG motif-containing sortase-dependent surface protein n=1 Tax=Streptomyces sp. NRRL F-5123 TaxID=1463856 RepID=UPI0006941ACE|nr:LAETG motif-containing sortase-dependent surface protein [Streptomyces sp. NRRL F-5123]